MPLRLMKNTHGWKNVSHKTWHRLRVRGHGQRTRYRHMASYMKRLDNHKQSHTITPHTKMSIHSQLNSLAAFWQSRQTRALLREQTPRGVPQREMHVNLNNVPFFFPFLGLSLVGEMSSGVAHSCPEGEGLFLMWLFILTHVLVYLPRVTAFHHLTNVIAQRRMRLHVSEVYIYITICAVFLCLLL